MYKVSTYNLSADFRHAQSDLGSNELGSITSEQLFEILEQFRGIDAVESNNASPRIDISIPAGRFNVNTSSGKLLLIDTADPSRMAKELTALEIVDFLEKPLEADAPAQEPEINVASPARRSFNHGISFAMLVVGMVLNGYTLYSAFYIEDVNAAPPLVLLTEKAEIRTQTEILAGTFTTGNDIGDRSIIVAADGMLKLQEFAAKGAIRTQSDRRPFSLGKRDEKLFLAMKPRGQIEVTNRDTLLLYGDTYRRVK
ncbi:MAG: hypothetical protein WC378_15315 [Opitutaceae bacterium]|jgi:hypothetical protein